MKVTIVFLMSQNPQVQIFVSLVAKMSLLHIWNTGHRTDVQYRHVGQNESHHRLSYVSKPPTPDFQNCSCKTVTSTLGHWSPDKCPK